MDELGSQKTWNWLKMGSLKKKTEEMSVAAQEQALRTDCIKS